LVLISEQHLLLLLQFIVGSNRYFLLVDVVVGLGGLFGHVGNKEFLFERVDFGCFLINSLVQPFFSKFLFFLVGSDFHIQIRLFLEEFVQLGFVDSVVLG